jgi:hypothetical protein
MTDQHNQRFTKEIKMKRSRFLVPFLLLSVAVAPALAQRGPRAQQRMPARMGAPVSPLTRLARVLEQAGAPALGTDEQTQLTTLITNFRSANAPQPPSDAVKTAHQNFDNAILSGDSTGAASQVAILVNNQSTEATARMQAQANFAIEVIKILRANGQVDPLLKQIGEAGVVRLAMSLAGGPGVGGRMGQGAMWMRRSQQN